MLGIYTVIMHSQINYDGILKSMILIKELKELWNHEIKYQSNKHH